MTGDIEGMDSGEIWQDFHDAEHESFLDDFHSSGRDFGEFLTEAGILGGRADGKTDAEIADGLEETLLEMERKRPGDNPVREKLRLRIQELRGE